MGSAAVVIARYTGAKPHRGYYSSINRWTAARCWGVGSSAAAIEYSGADFRLAGDRPCRKWHGHHRSIDVARCHEHSCGKLGAVWYCCGAEG